MSTTSDRYCQHWVWALNSAPTGFSSRVSHMLTRVETLKRNGTQQANNFQTIDQRLQRLEDMQATTLELLNVLVQNTQPSAHAEQTLINSDPSKRTDQSIKETDEEEMLSFGAISTTSDGRTSPTALPSSSVTNRTLRSSSFSSRKAVNAASIPSSAPPQIIVNSYSELLSMKASVASTLSSSDERLSLGTANLCTSSSTLNVPDDSSHQNLCKAEETEHSIYGKLIKERFRKLSEVVEDIERTLPNHQQRRESKHEKCDIIDDDETLSTLDWVETSGRMAFNSTRASRCDINQDEPGTQFMAAGERAAHRSDEEFGDDLCFLDQLVHDEDQTLIPDVLIHSPVNDETKSPWIPINSDSFLSVISGAKNNQIYLSQDLSSFLPAPFSIDVYSNESRCSHVNQHSETNEKTQVNRSMTEPFLTSAFYQSSTFSVCCPSHIYFSMLNNERTESAVLFCSSFTIYIVSVLFGTVFLVLSSMSRSKKLSPSNQWQGVLLKADGSENAPLRSVRKETREGKDEKAQSGGGCTSSPLRKSDGCVIFKTLFCSFISH